VGRYEFQLAGRPDDADLRAILAATPMAGRIGVSFRREPSFFNAASVDGDFHQVVACRDRETDRIIGFGCRSVRRRFVNGRPMAVGYLSGLRVLPDYRSLGLVARGFKYFRDLHRDGRAEVYLTTIAEGNTRAVDTLTSGRAGLPEYTFAGLYHTVVIPIPRRRRPAPRTNGSLEIRPATKLDRDAVVAFLDAVGPARQFFPCLGVEDFFEPASTYRDLGPADLLLAYRGDKLIGTLGAWNQQGFRQTVVEHYARPLAWARPFYNAWAKVAGRPGLVRAGEPIRHLTAAIPAVLDDDADVFDSLLRAALARAAGAAADYLLVGLHETDPLLTVARRLGVESYVTRMYLVTWDEGRAFRARLDGRPAYLELGFL
jgi:hypothetical protein